MVPTSESIGSITTEPPLYRTLSFRWSQSHLAYEVFQREVEPESVSLVVVGVAEPPLDDLRAGLVTSAYPDLDVDILWVQATKPGTDE